MEFFAYDEQANGLARYFLTRLIDSAYGDQYNAYFVVAVNNELAEALLPLRTVFGLGPNVMWLQLDITANTIGDNWQQWQVNSPISAKLNGAVAVNTLAGKWLRVTDDSDDDTPWIELTREEALSFPLIDVAREEWSSDAAQLDSEGLCLGGWCNIINGQSVFGRHGLPWQTITDIAGMYDKLFPNAAAYPNG